VASTLKLIKGENLLVRKRLDCKRYLPYKDGTMMNKIIEISY
jgi:hypothetical protein